MSTASPWYLPAQDISNTKVERLNLCIDIGNTRTKTAVFEGQELIDYCEQSFQSFVLGETWHSYDHVMISSTKSSIDSLKDILKKDSIHYLSHDTSLPIKNAYGTPKTLGKDRIAAAVAAHLLYPDECTVIIDAGTCITLDVIEKETYLGGNISPGMKMRSKAMHEYTGLLPEVDINFNPQIIGTNTRQALENGILYGTIWEIESFIARNKEAFSDIRINVILTGGDAKFLAKHINCPVFVDENLVLKGLNEILRHNV